MNPWTEYERRKAALQLCNLSQRQYEAAIRNIADELGV